MHRDGIVHIKLHAGHNAHADARAFGHGLRHAHDGIVIRQRNERKPGILCRAHNGGRRFRAVRINGMGMQVKRLHRGSSSL